MRIAWRTLPAVLLLLGLFAAWELYVDLGNVDPLILPAPHEVAKALFSDRSLLWTNFVVTAKEVLLGILLAAVAGLVLAIAIHFSDTLRRAVYPLLVASQAIPFPILAFVLVLWLGFGLVPKLIVIALVSFFPIVVSTLAGLAAVDPDLLKLMRTFDAPRRRTFWHVEFPAALPGVLTGASSGLGYLFQQSQAQDLIPRAYATVTILCLFAIALFALLTLAERLALPWAYEPRGDR